MNARESGDARLRALMAEYQAGRFDAFDELYRLVSPVVRRYLLSQARDAARAEDLLQETFLQMHRARHTYDPSLPLMPWMMAIARHCWLMHLRISARRPRFEPETAASEPRVRADADRLADRTEVREAVAALPAAQRHAVVAHHVWGFSFQEIAARLGIAETAAKLRSSRGIRQLRSRLVKR
jgi:RNA polymerase sigma-70 factor (ECF subfamily)